MQVLPTSLFLERLATKQFSSNFLAGFGEKKEGEWIGKGKEIRGAVEGNAGMNGIKLGRGRKKEEKDDCCLLLARSTDLGYVPDVFS